MLTPALCTYLRLIMDGWVEQKDAFLNINNASDFASFRTALSKYVAPAQNFVFADGKNGDIGYQIPGYVPQRMPGHTGKNVQRLHARTHTSHPQHLVRGTRGTFI